MPNKERSLSHKQSRGPVLKPAWDSTIHNLKEMKLTPAEVEAKRMQLQSHNHVAIVTQRMVDSFSHLSDDDCSDEENRGDYYAAEQSDADSETGSLFSTFSDSTGCSGQDSLSELSESLSDATKVSQPHHKQNRDSAGASLGEESENQNLSCETEDGSSTTSDSDSDLDGRSLQRRATAFVRSTKGPAVTALPELEEDQEGVGTKQPAALKETSTCWSKTSKRAAVRGEEAAAAILNWPMQGEHPLETRRSGAITFTGASRTVSRQQSPSRQPVQHAQQADTSHEGTEKSSREGSDADQLSVKAAQGAQSKEGAGQAAMRDVAVGPASPYKAGTWQQMSAVSTQNGDVQGAARQNVKGGARGGVDGEAEELSKQVANLKTCHVALQAEVKEFMCSTTKALAEMQSQLRDLALARPVDTQHIQTIGHGRGIMPQPVRSLRGTQPAAAEIQFPGAHLLPSNLVVPCQPGHIPLRELNRQPVSATARKQQEDRKPAHRTLRFPSEHSPAGRLSPRASGVDVPMPRSLPSFLSQADR